jgi:hypothetical protein
VRFLLDRDSRPAPSPSPRRDPSPVAAGNRPVEVVLATIFLVSFAVLAAGQAASTSATFDEVQLLPAGYAALRWGDHRLNIEHPPLVKMLAAVPLLLHPPWPAEVEPGPEDLQPGARLTTLRRLRIAWASALQDRSQQWPFGHLFLYGVRDATLARLGVESRREISTTTRLAPGDFENDADALLLRGRFVVIGLGLALAGLVFVWARTLFGPPGGLLALALCAFDPNLIAHAALATTDLGVTLFFFAALYFLWRTCLRVRAGDAVLTAASVALALVTKFSALLLVPLALVLVFGRALIPMPWPVGPGARVLATRGARGLAAAALLALVAAASLLAIWGIYGFRYAAARDPARAALAEARLGLRPDPVTGRQPGHLSAEYAVRRAVALLTSPPPELPQAPAEPGAFVGRMPSEAAAWLLSLVHRHRLVPEAYLCGLISAGGATRGGGATFLRGSYSLTGFRTYFVWTALLKTPLVTLVLVVAALVRLARAREPDGLAAVFLLVPVLAYFGMAVNARLNLGHRHLLPIYPFLYVAAGGLGAAWARWPPRWRPAGARLALVAIAAGAFVVLAPPWRPALVYPHYLAYFNELAGGPREGARSLVDSNLDWGQDLPALRRWLEHRGITEPVNLSLFGLADPLYHGIPHLNLPGGYPVEPGLPFARDAEGRVDVPGARRPGYLAISATNLVGAYMSPDARATWRALLADATLVDTVGYSIFVYRLGPRAEAQDGRRPPGEVRPPEPSGPAHPSL